MGGASHLAQKLRDSIDEGDGRTGNLLVDGTVYGVVDQGLVVGSDPESDGTIDPARNNAFRERERDTDRQAANQHLTEETLRELVD